MKNPFLSRKQAQFFFLVCIALAGESLHAKPTNSIHPLLREEALKIQKALLNERPYSINRNSIVRYKIILPKRFGNHSELAPPWWSPERGNQLSQYLSIALEKYSGLNVEKTPTWDQIILRNELGGNLESNKISSNPNPLLRRIQDRKPIHINVSFANYSSIYLKPKKRGIGLGLISFTNKSCSLDSHMQSTLSIDKPQSTGFSDDQLLIQSHDRVSEGGTSLNLNLGLAGAGGGSFDTPKIDLKKLVFEHIADTAEGIYCIATNNAACLKFYSEREPFSHKKYKEKDIAKSTEC